MDKNIDLKAYTEKQTNEKIVHYASGLHALKDLTDLGNADENMSQDYAGRFAFELLQNGADAYQKASILWPSKYPPGKGKVKFILIDDYLIVANTGIPFSHEPHPGDRDDVSSIESISRLGESTKPVGEYIGNKGIGFRSIYQICNRFWLISGGNQICYDGKKTYQAIISYLNNCSDKNSNIDSCLKYIEDQKDRIPMLKVGFWFDYNELPVNVYSLVKGLHNENFDTILILDRQENGLSKTADIAFIWDRLASLSEKEILFLKTLSKVYCINSNLPDANFSLELETKDDLKIVHKHPDGEKWKFLVFSFPMPGLEEKNQQAQIAFQLSDNNEPLPSPSESRVFYTFYPATKEKHGFPFYIHSYFILSPNREYFNFEAKEKVERNRILLKSVIDNFVSTVIPKLKKLYPDTFLPDIIMPKLNEVVKERLSDLVQYSTLPPFEFLSREGALTAWFVKEFIQKLSDQEIICDLRGKYMPITEIKRVVSVADLPLVQTADCFLTTLGNNATLGNTPPGLTSQNAKLNEALNDIESFMDRSDITIDLLAQAIETADRSFSLEPAEACSLIVLLSGLAKGDNSILKKYVDRIRQTKQPFLPCRGLNNNQPFPQYPEQGKLIRATVDSPLVFYSPTMADVEEDMTEVEVAEVTEKLEIPYFCHVHVLKDEVLTSVPQLEPDRMRAILKDKFGLRPFKPEDIFNRIAESTLTNEQILLSDDQHREFLEVTLRLIERLRIKGRITKREYIFDPWYLGERDARWRLYYFLSKSYIPLADRWERGNRIILAGKLSESGEKIRPLYEGTDQVFLTDNNESPWFVDLLNSYFDKHYNITDAENKEDLVSEKIRFRSYLYRLLGAWDGLRFDIFYQQAWQSSPLPGNHNPHSFIAPEEWQEYLKTEKIKSPWSSYPIYRCRLVTSAAIPYFKELIDDPLKRDLITFGFQNSLPIIEKHRHAEISSPNYSPAYIKSYLFYQLKNYPWVESGLRDEVVADDARIWFTRQDISRKTHDRQSAHFLRSVTAREISEKLASAIEMQILEDANPQQVSQFVELYNDLCKRVQQLPFPGPGFLTLYQTVVSKIQQVMLGQERQSDEKVSQAKDKYKDTIEKLLKSGVIVFNKDNSNLELSSDINGVYYDDTGVSNSIFRKMLRMAAFDDTSQGFARILGVKLLSSVDITYDTGNENIDVGWEDIESELKRIMEDLKVPLFAFRAFAVFTPEGQRLKVGEDTYDRRWKMYGNLRPKVVPILKVLIEDKEPLSVPPDIPVVLEHETRSTEERRVFVRQSVITGYNRIPMRVIARPLAIVLGSEAQTIAVEMLLKQYEDGLDAVHEYLFEQCGVSADQLREIEEFDERLFKERDRQLKELESKVINAIKDYYKDDINDELEVEDLRLLLRKSLSINTPDVLDYIQNKTRVPLYKLAVKLGIEKAATNSSRFKIMKGRYRNKLLIIAASKNDIKTKGQAWENLLESYDDACLDDELSFYWQPGDDILWRPIGSWIAKQTNGNYVDYDGIHSELTEEEHKKWTMLTNKQAVIGESDNDEQMKTAILSVFIPWIIALAKKSVALPVTDLLDTLDGYCLEEMANNSTPLEEMREQFEDYLKRFHVQQSYIDALLSKWPDVSFEGTALNINCVETVRLEIERLRNNQLSQSEKTVKNYMTYVDELIQENKLKINLAEIYSVKPGEGDHKVKAENEDKVKKKTMQKQKMKIVSEDDYIATNFRNRVVGECGERFVLALQRHQWTKLVNNSPEQAKKCLQGIESYYSLDNSQESMEWKQKKDRLMEIDPLKWVDDDNWRLLCSLLYMAKWSVAAGYDILGLFNNKDNSKASIVRVEVKATRGKSKLDFPISSNELTAAEHDSDNYWIWRVLNVAHGRVPSSMIFRNPNSLIQKGILKKTDHVTILRYSSDLLKSIDKN